MRQRTVNGNEHSRPTCPTIFNRGRGKRTSVRCLRYLGSTGALIAGELGTLIGADTVILGGFDSLAGGMSLGSVGVDGLLARS